MTQTFRSKNDNKERSETTESPSGNTSTTNRPAIASTPRTVTTPREPNPTDAYAGTFSPTKATGTGSRDDRPTEDEIRRRAYEIYQSRGGEVGRENEDWVQAERELRQKRKATR